MGNMIFAITKDIAGFFLAYVQAASLVAFLVVLFFWLWLAFYKFVLGKDTQVKRIYIRKSVLLYLLVFYIYIVIGITILSRSESGTREVSFQLFRTFRNTFMAKKQIYENIIMFVPYGILMYVLAEPFRRLWVSLVLGAVSSLLIEVTQWVTQTGYFEVDDILTNTIGMIAGYTVCVLVYKLKDGIRKTPQR